MSRLGHYEIRVSYVLPNGTEAIGQTSVDASTHPELLEHVFKLLMAELDLIIKAHEGPEVAVPKPNTVAQLTAIEKMVEEAQARLARTLTHKVSIAKYTNCLMFSGKLKEKNGTKHQNTTR
jgi:hypothetical protein